MKTGKRYVCIVGSKGSDTGPFWCRIFDGRPTEIGVQILGPYRDKTDAENAAEDWAKVNGIELEWTEW